MSTVFSQPAIFLDLKLVAHTRSDLPHLVLIKPIQKTSARQLISTPLETGDQEQLLKKVNQVSMYVLFSIMGYVCM